MVMQIIDKSYIEGILALEDGTQRLLDWVIRLIDEKDVAQSIASMCAKHLEPLKRQNRDLQAANTQLTITKREALTEVHEKLEEQYAATGRILEHLGGIHITIREAADRAQYQRIALEKVEWSRIMRDLATCPCCHGYQGEGGGHHPDCELGKALGRVPL